jgi:glycosyltransferase involved in cell wall biosynthesis
MKVINIIQCTNLGGMERASVRLMEAMQENGYDFSLISLHSLGALKGDLDRANISSVGLNYWGPAGIGVIRQIASQLVKRSDAQIIMTGPHLAAMLGMKLAGRRGKFLAVHYHHEGVKSPAAWRFLYRMALDRFDWVTFPSDFVHDEACSLFPALAARSLTIRYPNDPPPAITHDERNTARHAWNLADDAFVVGNGGWLIHRKRFDIFIRVAARVAAVEPKARFLIAGGGEDEAKLRALAEELGIEDRIIWLGWLENMQPFYHALDALLFNTEWDALPVTPQEAVASGIPLVASVANGGLREIFDTTLAERILKTHDIEALADQLIEIANKPQLAHERAQSSRDHFLKLSNPQKIAEAHIRIMTDPP